VSQAPDLQQKIAELLKVLVDQKIISGPQADIALADAEVTGMSIDEVLIARRWVTEDRLYGLAPWLKQEPLTNQSQPSTAAQTPTAPVKTFESLAAGQKTPDDSEFEDNLRKYRQLMEEILGEANK